MKLLHHGATVGMGVTEDINLGVDALVVEVDEARESLRQISLQLHQVTGQNRALRIALKHLRSLHVRLLPLLLFV